MFKDNGYEILTIDFRNQNIQIHKFIPLVKEYNTTYPTYPKKSKKQK